MMNELDRAWAELRKRAAAMNDSMMAELNAVADTVNAAQASFNQEMEEVTRLRNEADAKASAAVRAYDTAMTQSTGIILGIKMQLQNGSAIEAKPRLVVTKQ